MVTSEVELRLFCSLPSKLLLHPDVRGQSHLASHYLSPTERIFLNCKAGGRHDFAAFAYDVEGRPFASTASLSVTWQFKGDGFTLSADGARASLFAKPGPCQDEAEPAELSAHITWTGKFLTSSLQGQLGRPIY